ncbi:uncharacterized protein LOC133918497 [Phragmites australis]|uniref:uncharacterized protein LOC133918497 n=1 Tax=Phragmites australis TaxID=29695 RepID=UPI002D795F03|nr:uncharacterized protein LOC133918497 [Phragmites australis]
MSMEMKWSSIYGVFHSIRSALRDTLTLRLPDSTSSSPGPDCKHACSNSCTPAEPKHSNAADTKLFPTRLHTVGTASKYFEEIADQLCGSFNVFFSELAGELQVI